MPWAIVCSESSSTAAAIASASSGASPCRVVMSTTRNSPRVSVPVLSKNTAVTVRASSSPPPVANKKPAARTERGGDRDDKGDREAKRMRTGDDQDSDDPLNDEGS